MVIGPHAIKTLLSVSYLGLELRDTAAHALSCQRNKDSTLQRGGTLQQDRGADVQGKPFHIPRDVSEKGRGTGGWDLHLLGIFVPLFGDTAGMHRSLPHHFVFPMPREVGHPFPSLHSPSGHNGVLIKSTLLLFPSLSTSRLDCAHF